MASKKQPPGVGKMPKAATGKCGPGMGSVPTVDNTRGNPTAPASGKAHRSMGGKERKGSYPNASSDLPTLGGNPPKIRSDNW